MTTDIKNYKERLDYLLNLAGMILQAKTNDGGTIPRDRVDREMFAEFRSGGLALILKVVGQAHPMFVEFDRNVSAAFAADVEKGRGILKALKSELQMES